MTIKKITRAIVLTALFLIPLFSLIVADTYFFPFITGKAFYFRILVEVAFAGWLILCALDAKYRPKLNLLTIGVTVFAAITLFADLLGVSPIRSLWSNFERMEGWITIIHLWAFFMVMTGVFGTGEDGWRLWKKWLICEMAVALTVAMYGVLQISGVLAIHQGSTRIDASLGNAAYMAVYMLLNAGFIFYLFMKQKDRFNFKIKPADMKLYWTAIAIIIILLMAFVGLKIVQTGPNAIGHYQIYDFIDSLKVLAHAHTLTFLLVLMVAVVGVTYPLQFLPLLFAFEVFETATRGTILGLAGGIMLACFLYAVLGKNEKPVRRWIAACVIFVIIAVGGGIYAAKNSSFVKNHDVLDRLASISWSDAQGQARNYIWPMALQGAVDRPILGWGQENFNYIFNADYNPKMWNQEQWFDRAHSVYLDWLTASGIVGLLAYLSLYVLFLITVWKSSLMLGEKSVLTGLLAGYAVHNVFVFDNLASYVLFFASLAFVSSFSKNKPISSFGTEPLSAEAVEYVAAPAVIVALILVIYFFSVRPIEANTRLIAALQDCGDPQAGTTLIQSALAVNTYVANQEIREQTLSCASQVIGSQQASGTLKQDFYNMSLQVIQDQIKATPWKDARIYVLGGTFLDQIGQYGQANALLKSAHELSPGKQSIDLGLSDTYINTGDLVSAVTLLQQAYLSATDDTQIETALAVALVADGQDTVAKALPGISASFFQTDQAARAYMIAKQYDKALPIYRALLAANPTDVTAATELAQAEYAAGQISATVATLRDLEKNHPEYKTQIDASIKQIQP